MILGLACSLFCVFLFFFLQSWLSFWMFHCWPLCLCLKDRGKCGTIGHGDGFQAFLCDCLPLTLNLFQSNLIISFLHRYDTWPQKSYVYSNFLPSPYIKCPVSVCNTILLSWSPSFILQSSFSLLLSIPLSVAKHSVIFKLMSLGFPCLISTAAALVQAFRSER